MAALATEMRIIAFFKKGDEVRFVSHLDMQRMLHRTVRRAAVPIAYSQGYNPHPLISFATALSVGQTADGELIDFKMADDIDVSEFVSMMNEFFPQGYGIARAVSVSNTFPSVSTMMVGAIYTVAVSYPDTVNDETASAKLSNAVSDLMSGAIHVRKKKKSGRRMIEKDIDIRPMVNDVSLVSCAQHEAVLRVDGRLDASGGLNIELFVGALLNAAGVSEWSYLINRDRIVLSQEM